MPRSLDFYGRVLGFEKAAPRPGGYTPLAMYRHVVAQRWPRAAELTQRPWGLTDFRVTDPDGYSWRVSSR